MYLSLQGVDWNIFFHVWEGLTSDGEILQLVKGVKLEFVDDAELPAFQTAQPRLNHKERKIIHSEIQKLAGKKILSVSPCEARTDQILSPIFTRPKKDGSHSMILNLKNLNQDIECHHFKMDTLLTALTLITPGCYMASIDLKDAYYSVPIDEQNKKFLCFMWDRQLWQFDCLPNGLALAPRKFTKLLKPVFAHLRQQGHISTAFLDDFLLLAESELACVDNIQATVQLLRSLGFIIHPDKSVLIPSQTIQYLGVIINSCDMTVTLTEERKASLLSACNQLLRDGRVTIRELAKVIGKNCGELPCSKIWPLTLPAPRGVQESRTERGKGGLWQPHFSHTICQRWAQVVVGKHV